MWTLPTNLGEGLVILAAITAGITLPILSIHILWINMSTTLLLGDHSCLFADGLFTGEHT